MTMARLLLLCAAVLVMVIPRVSMAQSTVRTQRPEVASVAERSFERGPTKKRRRLMQSQRRATKRQRARVAKRRSLTAARRSKAKGKGKGKGRRSKNGNGNGKSGGDEPDSSRERDPLLPIPSTSEAPNLALPAGFCLGAGSAKQVAASGVFGGGVYLAGSGPAGVSIDGGICFSRSYLASTAAVTPHPTDGDRALAATAEGLFETSSSGDAWLPMGLSGIVRYAAYDTRRPSTVFAEGADGMQISTDGGDTFSDAKEGDAPSGVVAMRFSETHAYAATSSGLFRSGSGTRWAKVLDEPITGLEVVGDRIVVIAKGTLKTSDDQGQTFNPSDSAPDEPSALAATGTYLVAADESGLHESRNRGERWKRIAALSGTASSLSFTGGGSLFAVVEGQLLEVVPGRGDASSAIREVTSRQAREPSLDETLERAMREARVHPEQEDKLYKSVRRSAFLPDLRVNWRVTNVDGLTRAADLLNTIPAAVNNTIDAAATNLALQGNSGWFLGINLVWDMKKMSNAVAKISSIKRMTGGSGTRGALLSSIAELFRERQRVLYRLYLSPPSTPLGRQTLKLYLTEITAELNVHTHGLWEREMNWVERLNVREPS